RRLESEPLFEKGWDIVRATILTLAVVAGAALLGTAATRAAAPASDVPLPVPAHDPCPPARHAPTPSALQLPAVVPPGEPVAIELKMLAYLRTYEYRKLGWCEDKYVRDTGPYVHGQYYGTHPAV